jgi:hypothetical protein
VVHGFQIESGSSSCERGCKLYLMIDGVAKSPDETVVDTVKTCKHSQWQIFITTTQRAILNYVP